MKRKQRNLEKEIAMFWNMKKEQIDGLLRAAGLDPNPTIEAIRNLIEKARDEAAEALRGVHHGLMRFYTNAWMAVNNAV